MGWGRIGRRAGQRGVVLGAESGALAALAAGVASVALAAAPAWTVSQRNQAFNPGEITLKRGEVVRIVNDDGDLLHHAYIESKAFSFDSGDQEPGSRVDVTFPAAGTFTVLCGIHPKMRLVVHVE